MMLISDKQLHKLGFKYNWINRNFKDIKEPRNIGSSNAYDVNKLASKAREILMIRLNSTNVKQNYKSETMLEKLINDLK